LRKVIFDSSFLMSVSENPTKWRDGMVEILGSFEPVLLDCVREELVTLSKGRGKKARLAGLALQLAAGFSPGPCGRADVDDEVASAAIGGGAAVATVDRVLTATLRAMHVDVVGLRSGRVMLR
jgi:rRNA-processing protein FCF1